MTTELQSSSGTELRTYAEYDGISDRELLIANHEILKHILSTVGSFVESTTPMLTSLKERGIAGLLAGM